MHKAYREQIIVLLSLVVQTPLAIFLGHYYDERVFMATGYFVSSGLNPYQPHELIGVFSNPLLAGVIPSIGYPPLWPILLGIIFRLSFNILPNLYLYNFAIKIPVIIGNIALAYLVRHVLKGQANPKQAQTAWLFVLFNPFVLLTTSAWGEFDTVVALFCVASVYLLSVGKTNESALLLAIGAATKPIALPLVGLPLLFSTPRRSRKTFQYLLIFTLVFLACYFAPFYFFGWNVPLTPNEWNAQFEMAGGMSPFNIIELFQVSTVLPAELEFLGFLWVPALIIGYFALSRNVSKSMDGLTRKALCITLVFFLTRSWLSEPNINLILPFMLLTTVPGKKNFSNFHFAWIIPTVFMFLNFSFPQLFFLPFPSVLNSLASLDQQFGTLRLIVRFLIAIIWQILSWNLVAKMFRTTEEKQT